MTTPMPTAVLLAGPNGAGKTTFINQFLRERAAAFHFVNPDEVARDVRAGPDLPFPSTGKGSGDGVAARCVRTWRGRRRRPSAGCPLHPASTPSPTLSRRGGGLSSAWPDRVPSAMSSIFDNETVLKALRRAAWVAKHGTREEQSGKFLPPPGWEGHLVTARHPPARPEDAPPPKKKRA